MDREINCPELNCLWATRIQRLLVWPVKISLPYKMCIHVYSPQMWHTKLKRIYVENCSIFFSSHVFNNLHGWLTSPVVAKTVTVKRTELGVTAG